MVKMKIFRYLFLSLILLLIPSICDAEVKISILKFENKGRGEFDYLERGITSMIENDLFCLEGITVLERTKTGELIDELYLNQLFEGGFDENKLQRLGKSFISDYILSGEIKIDGNTLDVKAKLFLIPENKFVLEKSFSGTIADTFLVEKAIIIETCKYLSISENKKKNFAINIRPKPTLAVSYFGGYIHTGELSQLRKGLADLFIADLSMTGLFKVVERENLQKVLEELKLQDAVMISSQESLKLGKLLGAELYLFGAYTKIEDKLRIDIKIVKVESGELIAVYTAEDDTEKFGKILSVLVKDIVDSCRTEQSALLSEQLPQIEKRTLESTLYISKALYYEDWRQYEEAVKNYNNAIYVNPSLDKELLLKIAKMYNYKAQNYDMAAKYYELYLGKYPEPEYFFNLAHSYCMFGHPRGSRNYEKAFEVYDRIIKHYPERANRARKDMAIIYYQELKDYGKALSIYKDMLKESISTNNNFEANRIKAEMVKCLMALNLEYESIEPYVNDIMAYILNKENEDSIIKNIREFTYMSQWLNTYFKETGNVEKGHKINLRGYEIIKNLINKDEFAYRSFLINLGGCEYQLGMYDLAEKRYREHIRLFPDDNRSWCESYLNNIESKKTRIQQIKDKMAISNESEKPALIMELAKCYPPEKATKMLWELVEKELIENDFKVDVLFAIADINSKGYSEWDGVNDMEAVRAYMKILEIDSAWRKNLYDNLAECMEKLGNYAEAIEYYNKFLEINPNNKIAEDKLRLCMLKLKNKKSPFEHATHLLFNLNMPEKALPYFETYLKEFPSASEVRDGTCQLYIAHCYKDMEQYDEALKEYAKVTYLQSNSMVTQSYVAEAYMERAKIFENLGNYSVAEKELVMALSNNRYAPDILKKLAELYLYKIRDYDKAINYFQKLKLSETWEYNVTAEYYIGRCYEKLENYAESIKHYKLFLEEYVDSQCAKRFHGHLPTDCLDVHQRISNLKNFNSDKK